MLELGRLIRARKDETKIVFVSEAESRVFESFMVQPLGFVRKSNFLNDISAVVELYMKTTDQEKAGDFLEFATRTGILALKSSQVCYIEGSRNYQLLNIDGRLNPIEIKMTMDSLEKMTEPYGFIRIHKGFLVNFQYIQHLSSTEAVLINGTQLPIGRSKVSEVKMKYLELIGKYTKSKQSSAMLWNAICPLFWQYVITARLFIRLMRSKCNSLVSG